MKKANAKRDVLARRLQSKVADKTEERVGAPKDKKKKKKKKK